MLVRPEAMCYKIVANHSMKSKHVGMCRAEQELTVGSEIEVLVAEDAPDSRLPSPVLVMPESVEMYRQNN
jgi:hypothetical protein